MFIFLIIKLAFSEYFKNRKENKKMKTLWDTFMNAYDHAVEIPWRVYEKSSRKLLCEDYGQTTVSDELDDRKFYKAEKKRFKNGHEYWKIVVY